MRSQRFTFALVMVVAMVRLGCTDVDVSGDAVEHRPEPHGNGTSGASSGEAGEPSAGESKDSGGAAGSTAPDAGGTGDTAGGDTGGDTAGGGTAGQHEQTSAGAVNEASGAAGAGGAEPEEPEPPEIFEANFLWEPLVLSGKDLGFVAEAVPASERVAAGPTTLVQAADEDGLAGVIGRGNRHGVGVAFVDVDHDGWDDLFIINGTATPSRFFKNNRGHFEDGAEAANLDEVFAELDGYSIAAADYDNDGDVDVYIGARPTDILLRNNGDGIFEDVTAAANAGGPEVVQPGSASKIVSFGDFNNDGAMDLLSAYANVNTVGEGYLLRNEGDGSFVDVTGSTGFAPSNTGNPCAAMWTDFDNDGDQDAFVWNDRGQATANRALLRNDDGEFTDITVEANLVSNIGNPMGIDSADLNRDGYLDYAISDIGPGTIFLGNSDGTFTDIGLPAEPTGRYGWGTGFEDFNADSWIDLFMAQEDTQDGHYVYIHNQVLDPDPTFTGIVLPRFQPTSSAHNVAAAFADYDHNGLTDVITATTDGTPVNLYRNETDIGTNRWLHVRIPSVPETGERGGISARVVVKTGDLVQFRDMTGGSSRASQNAHSIRFGLGQYTGADWVAALWPDGRQLVVLGVEGNQVIELTPP